MAQKDPYKSRYVSIDFKPRETFEMYPYPNCFTLTLLTNGKLTIYLNGQKQNIQSPCFLCLTEKDQFQAEAKENVAAQSLYFHPDFLKTAPYEKTQEYVKLDLKIQKGSTIFDQAHIFKMDKSIYSQLKEWFFILGTEVFAQSDVLWVCRIKSYLIRIMAMLEDVNSEIKTDSIHLALDYIYENYYKKITVEELTRQAHLNRVSLNQKFKECYGCTAMEYLNQYRIQMAEELLIHTGMNLADISQSVGYEYDTYFMRQFSKTKGMSPTKYRTVARKYAENV